MNEIPSQTGQPQERDNGSQSARNSDLIIRLELLAVEAAIDDAVRRNATNNNRVHLDSCDIALRQSLMAVISAKVIDGPSHAEGLLRIADLYSGRAK